MTFSVAKSFLSLLAGLAVGDGLIKSLDDKVAGYALDDGFTSEQNKRHHLAPPADPDQRMVRARCSARKTASTTIAWSACRSPTRPRARAAR